MEEILTEKEIKLLSDNEIKMLRLKPHLENLDFRRSFIVNHFRYTLCSGVKCEGCLNHEFCVKIRDRFYNHNKIMGCVSN